MRVTMKQVAEKAGVSPSTVCRALSSNPQIPPETRERVRAVATEMGYKIDPLLSAFASRRRGKIQGSEATTIAYITKFSTADSWRQNPYYLQLYNGALARAEYLGYKLEHFWLKEPGMDGKKLSRMLYNRGISAVCVPPTPRVRGHISFDWERFSCVAIGYSVLRPNLHRTAPHHFHGMLMAVRELRRLGYRRIGFCIFTDTSRRVDDLWLAGILLCQQSLPDLVVKYLIFDDHSIKHLPEWTVREGLEVVIGGDPVVFRELRQSGLFPDRVDYVAGSWEGPESGLAGIDQRPDQIGATTIDLVIAQVQRGERGIPAVPITTMVEGRWRTGHSLRR